MTPPRPVVVALIGSTRFRAEYEIAAYQEAAAGRITLSPAFVPGDAIAPGRQADGADAGLDAHRKAAADRLHIQRIELADEVLVINPGGYLGETTLEQIAHARGAGKLVRYLVEPARA